MGFLLQSARLLEAGFPHGFTQRCGDRGEVLDFAFSSPRADASVSEVAAALGVTAARVFQVTQVHGADVVVIEGGGGDPVDRVRDERADALVLRSPTAPTAVGVRIADCIPLLVADPSSGEVAAVHAGWRGVVGRVAESALRRLSTGPKLAAIGPCIGPCCFEVSREVAEEIARATDASVIRPAKEPTKANVDLRSALRVQLRSLGLTDAAIEDVGGCTKCEASRYHSFRREGESSGRMLGVIANRRARP